MKVIKDESTKPEKVQVFMKIYRPILQIQIVRGNSMESTHSVQGVLVDDLGEILSSWGEFQTRIYPRSAVKFFQALPFIESGAIEKFDLDERHIAISAASHLGEVFHQQLVHQWLQKMGFSDQDLACGAHDPADPTAARSLAWDHQQAQKTHNNCSGKHASMLALCAIHRWKHMGYEKYSHPLQSLIRQSLTQALQVDHESLAWGIDGCGIPTYLTPLLSLARAGVYFQQQLENKKSACHILWKAISHYPEYVSGTHGFCTRIFQASKGDVLVKVGAEGVYFGMILPLRKSFALKVMDGAPRAAEKACLHFIQEAGYSLSEDFLQQTWNAPLRNWAGQDVGFIQVVD